MRTSFHYQPEAQHPNFPLSTGGRLPHLLAQSGHARRIGQCPLSGVKRTWLRDEASGHPAAGFAVMHKTAETAMLRSVEPEQGNETSLQSRPRTS